MGQLERLRDLYVLGDLTQAEYQMKRQVLTVELAEVQRLLLLPKLLTRHRR